MDAKTLGNQGAYASNVGPGQFGLTKRELFAAMAMQGFVTGVDGPEYPRTCAQTAVQFADALLAELAKDQP